MKKLLRWLPIFMLIAVGCSSPESKLTGRWKSPEVNGFEAEFKDDHTGATYTPMPGHAGTAQSAQIPFKWSIDKDGTVKVTEDKTVYVGKLKGKKLELEINDARVTLEKFKK